MALQHVRRPEGPQDWEAQRAVITDLYITKGLELEDLMKTMQEEHFFKATKKQYKTTFTKWDLRKNVRPAEYNAIFKKKRKREEEGKGSVFRLRGALVDDSKIVRYEKKTKIGDEDEIADAGTPENLSCFTPSPVTNSLDVPSLELQSFPSPSASHSSVTSPYEEALLLWNPSPIPPELRNHESDWTFFEFMTALVDGVESKTWGSVELDLHPTNCEMMDDIIMAGTCQSMERFLSSFSTYLSRASLPRLVSCLIQYTDKRVIISRIRQSALFYFLLFQKLYDIGIVSGYVTRSGHVTRQKSFMDSRIKYFPHSIQIRRMKTCDNWDGRASEFELSVRTSGCEILWKFSSVLRLHSLHGRHSESYENIRSLDSFPSDPVVNWKGLFYGYNP